MKIEVFLLIGALLTASGMQALANDVSLSGVVTDARTHSAVGQAHVSVVGDLAAHDEVTDDNGFFVLTFPSNVKAGDLIRLRIQKDGYRTYDEHVSVPTGGRLPNPISLQPVPSSTGHPKATQRRVSDEELPCTNALKFTQRETVNYIGGTWFQQKVTITPKHFEKGTVLPVVILRTTSKVTGGAAQGVMVNDNTGDPIAAGISVASGRLGVVVRGSKSAELWLTDIDKFSGAKAVVVSLDADERFRVTCVQQPPTPKTEIVLLPNVSTENSSNPPPVKQFGEAAQQGNITQTETQHPSGTGGAATITDADLFGMVTGWGVQAPPGTTVGGEGYLDLNTTKLLQFNEKYRLLVIIRAHDTRIDPLSDQNIQKSNSFSIGSAGTMSRITVPLAQQFLSHAFSAFGPEVQLDMYLCLVPRGLDISSITKLDDITARGGHVFNPSYGGGASLGPTSH